MGFQKPSDGMVEGMQVCQGHGASLRIDGGPLLQALLRRVLRQEENV